MLAILNIASAGQNIVSMSSIYGGTINLFAVTLKRLGIEVRFVTPEMSDEEVEKFTAEYQARMAAKMQLSFLIRIISMAATVALTFIFLEGIAAAIPLLMQRPLLYVNEFFRKKEDKKNI